MTPRGFSLVELMIGLLLSSLALAATLAGLARGTARYREFEARLQLHERGAHALGVLEPELQMSGYGGLRPLHALDPPAVLPSAAVACGTLAAGRLPASRFDTGYRLGCAAHAGGALAGSDVLTLVRASAQLSPPTPGRLQVWTARQASTPAQGVRDGASATSLPTGEGELRDLLVTSFYVSLQSDGPPGPEARAPSLRMKELTAIDGRAAFRDIEVISGVERLHALEGWRDDAGAPLRFARPGGRTGPLEAVHLCVLLRSPGPVVPPRPTRFRCGAAEWRFEDGFVRLLLERQMALRQPARAAA